MILINFVHNLVNKLFWWKYFNIFIYIQLPLLLFLIFLYFTQRNNINLSDLQIIYLWIASLWFSLWLKLIHDFKFKIYNFNKVNNDYSKFLDCNNEKLEIDLKWNFYKDFIYIIFVIFRIWLCITAFIKYYNIIFNLWIIYYIIILFFVLILAFLTSIWFVWMFIILKYIFNLKCVKLTFFHPDWIAWMTPIVQLLNTTIIYYWTWSLFLPFIISITNNNLKSLWTYLVHIFILVLILIFIISVYRIYKVSAEEKEKELLDYTKKINSLIDNEEDVEFISKKINFYENYLKKQNVFPFNINSIAPLFTSSLIPSILPYLLELINRLWK